MRRGTRRGHGIDTLVLLLAMPGILVTGQLPDSVVDMDDGLPYCQNANELTGANRHDPSQYCQAFISETCYCPGDPSSEAGVQQGYCQGGYRDGPRVLPHSTMLEPGGTGPLSDGQLCAQSVKNDYIRWDKYGWNDPAEYTAAASRKECDLPQISRYFWEGLLGKDEKYFESVFCWSPRSLAPSPALVYPADARYAGLAGFFPDNLVKMRITHRCSGYYRDYRDDALDACHPVATFGGQCVQPNRKKNCYVLASSQHFVLGYFPWQTQLPDADSARWGPSTHDGSAATPFGYRTGIVNSCSRCSATGGTCNDAVHFQQSVSRVKSFSVSFTAATEAAYTLYEGRFHALFKKLNTYVDYIYCQGVCVCDSSKLAKAGGGGRTNYIGPPEACSQPHQRMPCHFPFEYEGVTHDECTDVKNNGILWCSVSDEFFPDDPWALNNGERGAKYIGLWGNCVYDSADTQITVGDFQKRMEFVHSRSARKMPGDAGWVPLSKNRVEFPTKHDIRDYAVSAGTVTVAKASLCDTGLSAGCLMWDDSVSVNPCATYEFDGTQKSVGFINTCHDTEAWMKDKSEMYQKRATDSRYAEGFEGPDSGTKTALVHSLALFVPQLANFHEAFKLRLTTYSGTNCQGTSTVMSEDAAVSGAARGSAGTDTTGIFYIPAHTAPSFQLKVVSIASGSEIDLSCDCASMNDYGDTTLVHGSVSSNPGPLHECRMCAGNERVGLRPGTLGQCNSQKWQCVQCAANMLRGKVDPVDLTSNVCVGCPVGHLVNFDRPADTYDVRLASNTLSFQEMLQVSAERYGVPELLHTTLAEAQDFGSSDTYSHLENKTLEGGGYTCHYCPVGFRFQPGTPGACIPLRLQRVVPQSSPLAWGLNIVPSNTGAVVFTDEVTLDTLRMQYQTVPTDSYLDIEALRNEGVFRIQQCPDGPAVDGMFWHMCGMPHDKIYVRVRRADIFSAAVSAALFPQVDDMLLFDRSDGSFHKLVYYTGAANPIISTDPPPLPSAFAEFELEVAREGAEIPCQRCADGEYNGACSNSEPVGGSFGSCSACATQPPEYHWMTHALSGGCRGWGDPDVFVDSDYVQRPCQGVLEEEGQFRLCVGFCGFRETFKWWKPIKSDADLVQIVAGGPYSVDSYTCTATDSGNLGLVAPPAYVKCQHPDTALPFATVDYFQQCTDTLPYCPPGWYVDRNCVQIQKQSDFASELVFDTECCKQCQLRCEPGQRRRADWEVCPGDTTFDTQARCGEGCDVNFYLDLPEGVDEEDGQCRMCESCLEGLRV